MLDSQRFRIRWRICWELFVWSFKKLIVTIIPAEEGRYCSWSGKFCCLRVYWGASDSFYIVLLSLHLYFCVFLFFVFLCASFLYFFVNIVNPAGRLSTPSNIVLSSVSAVSTSIRRIAKFAGKKWTKQNMPLKIKITLSSKFSSVISPAFYHARYHNSVCKLCGRRVYIFKEMSPPPAFLPWV